MKWKNCTVDWPFMLGGVHKLHLQNLAFFDLHLPPSVYIFYDINVYKKSIFLTTYPPSKSKRSLWTPPYVTTEKEEQRRKLTPTVMTASFKNWSMFTEKLALLKYCLCSNWWERVARSPRAKKSEFLVNLDRFSKFLKYFKYFEKRSKLTKNSDFFACGECATLSHHFEPS